MDSFAAPLVLGLGWPMNAEKARFVVAIDGPAGAGKSTVSRMLARELGFALLDTGAIYRSVALAASRREIAWDDHAGLAALAGRLDLAFRSSPEGNRTICDGEDVSEAIRTPDISQGASKVSAVPGVRSALLELQRRIARQGSLVAEGRDVGTVVFPHAQAKFFLTAGDEERARRRAKELVERGHTAAIEEVLAEMKERDARDQGRAVAPLARAPDAVEIDSGGLSPTEVVARMANIVRARGG